MLRVVLPVFLVFLAGGGCKQLDLHHGLTELDADEIMVVLHQNGIEAKKEKEVSGQEISWKIAVVRSDLARARQILISNKLPKRRELGLSGVYKEKGLIPTPDEQKARFLLALKGEIINSLQRIPGVVEADVVLNVPTEGDFTELDPTKKKPTASVVIKTRNEEVVTQTVTEGKVQQFVANTVPNLHPNDVTVIVARGEGGPALATGGRPGTPAPVISPPVARGSPETSLVELAGVKLDAESVRRFKAYMIGMLSLLVSVSVFLLFHIVRFNRLRVRVQGATGGAKVATAFGKGTSGLLGAGQSGTKPMEGAFAGNLGSTQDR